jgi:hypothetical protein
MLLKKCSGLRVSKGSKMKTILKNSAFLSLFLALFPCISEAQLSIENITQLRAAFDSRVKTFSKRPSRSLRVAILDKGFDQAATVLNPACPFLVEEVREYSESFLNRVGLPLSPAGNSPDRSPHGTGMGLIFCQLVGGRSDATIEKLFLLNANGYTQLRRAVAYAVEQKIDLLLFPQSYDYLGNFDGRGLLKPIVDRYLSTGGFWLNPVGNAQGRVYNGRAERLNSYSSPLSLRFRSELDQNPITVSLTWEESWSNDAGGESEVDLDFEVIDSQGQVVAKSQRAQLSVSAEALRGAPVRAETSGFSRETATVTYSRGEYRIRVYWTGAKSPNRSDVGIRVTLTGERDFRAVKFHDASQSQEIMIPADHAGVLSISDGSGDASRGPTRDGRQKPEITWVGSDIEFSNGDLKTGTSNTSAMVLAAAAVFRSGNPDAPQSQFISQLRKTETSGNSESGVYYSDPLNGVLRRVVKASMNPYFMPAFIPWQSRLSQYTPQSLRYFIRDGSGETFVLPKGQVPTLSGERAGEKSPWVELIF